MRAVVIAVAALALTLGGATAEALRLPSAPRCPIFPVSNPWNQRVDRLPVARDSATIIRSIGLDDHVHADFGSGLWNGGPIGIPRSNRLRPAGWTSADAAGLPIFPGLARYDEVARGRIDHALRFTVSRTRRAYVWPARHVASDATDPSLPPMGLRVRLKAGVDTRPFPRQARIVLEALKRYGMVVADNGSDWYISGAPDPRWSNEQLRALKRVPGSAFEVVDTSRLRPRP